MGPESSGNELQLENQRLTAELVEARRVEVGLRARISELEAIEVAYQKSELRFQRFYNSGALAITTAGYNGFARDANDAFLRMLGYTREEMLNGELPWGQLTPPELRGLDEIARAQCQASGVASPYEKEYIHKDGRRVPVLIGAAQIDEEGWGVCFVLDLSDRKRAEEVRKAQAVAEAEVAARMQAEEALRKSEARLQKLSDAGVLGIVDADIYGNIFDSNETFAAMLGYTREELVSGGWRSITPADWLEQDAHAAERTLSAGVLLGYEKEFLHKDGRRVPVSIAAVLDGDAQGRGLSCVLDMSERRRLERELSKSELRFNSLAESGLVGIIVGDYSGQILNANDAFLDMLGYSKEDLTAGRLCWNELTPPEWWEHDARANDHCREMGVAPTYEKEYLHKDGRRVPVLIGGVQVGDSEGVCFVLDQSKRKRAEVALTQSEVRFRRLFDSGIIGMFTAGPNGSILDANAAFLGMVGYSLEDLTSGQVGWEELTPLQWREHDMNALASWQASRTNAYPTYEKEFLHKDGQRVPVLVGALMPDDGEEGRGTCIVLNLSARKQGEAALRASELRFQRLFDSGVLGIFRADSTGAMLDANAAFSEMVGYSREEIVSGTVRWDQLTPSEWWEQDARVVEFCRAGARAHPAYEKEFIHKDGRRIPVVIGAAMLDNDGTEGVCVVLDLSDLKRAESRYQRIFESEVLGIFTTDAQHNILAANTTFADLVGYTRGELTSGQVGCAELTPSDHREHSIQAFENSRGGRVPPFEKDFVHKDGRRIPVLVSSARIDQAAGEDVIIVLDQRDRKQAEELREAHAIAAAESRAKTEFLSLVSHELRTPLNAILGFTQLLLGDKRTPLHDRHRERAKHVLKGGEHLLRLIEDILDLSRIESGGVPISVEPTSAYEVMGELMPTLEPLALTHNVTVTLESAPEDVPLVAVDRTRLIQVLMNYAANAMKYNRPGGAVRLHLSQLEPDHVRVTVSDTGLGIPADRQDKLFQAFQRAGQETGSIEGTGIGLFTAKRLVQLMQGDVGFRSVFGEGSDFWVDLPIARANTERAIPKAPHLAQAKAAAMKARRILYVEDNPANLGFMQDLVTNFFDDVALSTATTGEFGLELARAHKFDVIVLDINLPGISGLDVLYELRTDSRTKAMPVIAVSAAASERDKQRGERAGFFAYLTKPINVEEFVTVVRRLFLPHDRTAVASPSV